MCIQLFPLAALIFPSRRLPIFDVEERLCSDVEQPRIQSEREGAANPLRDGRVVCLGLSFMCWAGGSFTYYILIKDYVVTVGLEEDFVWALSLLGLGEVVGKLGLGALLHACKLQSLVCYPVTQGLCATIVLVHLVLEERPSGTLLMVMCFVFGMMYAQQDLLLVLTPSCIRENPHDVNRVFGVLLFFGGIGSSLAPPAAGTVAQAILHNNRG